MRQIWKHARGADGRKVLVLENYQVTKLIFEAVPHFSSFNSSRTGGESDRKCFDLFWAPHIATRLKKKPKRRFWHYSRMGTAVAAVAAVVCPATGALVTGQRSRPPFRISSEEQRQYDASTRLLRGTPRFCYKATENAGPAAAEHEYSRYYCTAWAAVAGRSSRGAAATGTARSLVTGGLCHISATWSTNESFRPANRAAATTLRFYAAIVAVAAGVLSSVAPLLPVCRPTGQFFRR